MNNLLKEGRNCMKLTEHRRKKLYGRQNIILMPFTTHPAIHHYIFQLNFSKLASLIP